MVKKRLKVGVLISGSGSNLQALIDASMDAAYPAEIVLVLSNRKKAYGLERAAQAGISNQAVSAKAFETAEGFESELDRLLKEAKVDLICLAGFMKILGPAFIDKWEGKILNIHPSLLPKFGGVGMYGHHVHEAVLEAGETESGASVHIVTAGCDEGPVILQKSVPVEPDDTSEILAARVLKVEHEVYPEALKNIAEKILANENKDLK